MSLKDALNRASLSHLPDMLQVVKLGDFMRSATCRLYKKAASAPVPLDQIAAVHTIKLPMDCKAARILRAYARAGSGTPGELTQATAPMTSATSAGQINISAAGDLTFAAADAWTSVDVEYVPEELEVFSMTLPVASNDIALPAFITNRGAVMLMRATLDTGTVTGEGKIIAPGARSSTTLQVNLDAAKAVVQFVAADAVTKATFWVGVAPAQNRNDLLAASEGALF